MPVDHAQAAEPEAARPRPDTEARNLPVDHAQAAEPDGGRPRPDAPAEPHVKRPSESADDVDGPAPRAVPGAETASRAGPTPAPAAWWKGGRRALLSLAAAGLVAAAGLGLLLSRQSALATALQENLDAANAQARIAELETEAAQRIADELRGGAGVLTAGDVRTLDLAGQPAAPSAPSSTGSTARAASWPWPTSARPFRSAARRTAGRFCGRRSRSSAATSSTSSASMR